MLDVAKLPANYIYGSVVPDWDWETYSEAGYVWGTEPGYWKKAPKKRTLDMVLDESGSWVWIPPEPRLEGLPGAGKRRGLTVVGVYNYVMHETFRPIQLAYNLKDGRGPRTWKLGQPYPQDLLDHIASGGLIEAWNTFFEAAIYWLYCVPKLGWPLLREEQIRCCMAKAAISGIPRGLENAGHVLRLKHQKHEEGDKLIKLLTVPKAPTKIDQARCWTRETKPEEFKKFDAYNVGDILAESEASVRIPDLNPRELRVWQVDQRINHRGMQTDQKAIDDGICIVEQAANKYNSELTKITNGQVKTSNQVAETRRWLADNFGVSLLDLDEETVEEELQKPHDPIVLRVLKIRAMLSFGSVKKLYGMKLQSTPDGRLRDQFAYASAHTQLWNGVGPQVMNLYKSEKFNKPEQIELALGILASRNLEFVEAAFANGPPWDPTDNEPMEALEVIANCLRSYVVARPGARLMSADFSAIQAVVLAALAGEKWQLDTFHAGESLYLATASQMTGKAIEFYKEYARLNKKHHPDRQTMGKIPTLAGGFAAWIFGYRKFGAEGTDEQLKDFIKLNRSKIPATVEFWGGQTRNKFNRAPDGSRAPCREELYGLEGAAIKAIKDPGTAYGYRGVRYQVHNDILYCVPPGPEGMAPLVYHEPRIKKSTRPYAEPWEVEVSYVGWNTSKTKGKGGWERMSFYGGMATQNVVAKLSREFQADVLVELDSTKVYETVHHAHDENTNEVENGRGSLTEYLSIVNRPQPWAIDDWGRPWPVKAPGAEETYRYGKYE